MNNEADCTTDHHTMPPTFELLRMTINLKYYERLGKPQSNLLPLSALVKRARYFFELCVRLEFTYSQIAVHMISICFGKDYKITGFYALTIGKLEL